MNESTFPSSRDYSKASTEAVKSVCLYVATVLGDLTDHVVVVGGLVPTLIVDQTAPGDPHAGTLDLDLALSMALLDAGLYREISARLRDAGFRADSNDKGNRASQHWVIERSLRIAVDFLIEPAVGEADMAGRNKHLEEDFAAIIVPGLHLAFRDFVTVPLTGETPVGEKESRAMRVCGPGAFIVLKALACENRRKSKDAYDIVYILQNYGSGRESVVDRMRPLLDDSATQKALAILEEKFVDENAIGPVRVAEFLGDRTDEVARANAVGFCLKFLKEIRAT